MNYTSDLLRFTTAGSVDDGKSTLIGRLLYDSKAIFQDQYAAIENYSHRNGLTEVNLALLTDGLKAEREQGITIDVAYRYFSTPKRKFIIADTPGHIQYTRNMVTGASTANAALILVDARKGLVEQSKRHAILASLLQIPHLLICINKMDLVDYDQQAYEKIVRDFSAFSSKLDVSDVSFFPISALHGDNVVNRSEKMPWYEGSTLIYHLEHVHIASDYNHIDARFPVQYVIRPNTDDFHDFRGYSGRVEGGSFKPGDEVLVLPSESRATIDKVYGPDGETEEGFAPMSVCITLREDVDLSRGDMLVRPHNRPASEQGFDAMICWFDASIPLEKGSRFLLKQTTKTVPCFIEELRYILDINSLHRITDPEALTMNEIGRVRIKTAQPLFFDKYRQNRATGSLIIIDETSNKTVGAGMII